MKALMLAAGLGRRLYGDENSELPKSLLKFAGETLLQRHIESLVACGVTSLTLVVGHRHEDVLAEVRSVAPAGFVESVFNPRYREGPKLSLALGSKTLRSGDEVLFMDADVLYHQELLSRLVSSRHSSCFVMDRNFQSTDDFVKVCVRDDQVVDFGKVVDEGHDTVGEWPGFCKLAPSVARAIDDSVAGFIARDDIEGAYEEAMREVLVSAAPQTFGVEDITGIPWMEIDYKADLEKAARSIFPRIAAHNDGLADATV
jgi:choline kinase